MLASNELKSGKASFGTTKEFVLSRVRYAARRAWSDMCRGSLREMALGTCFRDRKVLDGTTRTVSPAFHH